MVATDVDRIRRPKPDAVGEKVDVGQVKSQVAQIHWRLNLQVSSVDVEQPAK